MQTPKDERWDERWHASNIVFYLTDPSICHHLGALKIAWVTSSPNDIIEGKSKDLQCYFSGRPLPHEVHWYKDGELITNQTEGIYHSEHERDKNGENTLRSTLHPPKGLEELEGFYKCSAKNSIPSSASFEIQMIYECMWNYLSLAKVIVFLAIIPWLGLLSFLLFHAGKKWRDLV